MTDVLAAQVTVTNAKAKLIAAIPNGQVTSIVNRDAANSIFVGPAGVTITTGQEVKPNTQLANDFIELPPETELWAISGPALTARTDVLQIVAD